MRLAAKKLARLGANEAVVVPLPDTALTLSAGLPAVNCTHGAVVCHVVTAFVLAFVSE